MRKFKKITGMILTLIFLFGLAGGTAVMASVSDSKVSVIIVFNDAGNKNIIAEEAGKITTEYKNFNNVVSAEIPLNRLEALSNNPKIASIEFDQKAAIEVQTVDWGVLRVEAPEIWNGGYTGNGIKVAVLDTGIDINHEDLIVQGGVNMINPESTFDDDNGHGTHCAGIIGAKNNELGTLGIAYNADVYSVKVLGANGIGSYSDIIEGIDWSITNDMDIISMSLGGSSGSSAMEVAINNAYDNGIIVVAASGNEGIGAINYPAAYDNVVAVGATDRNNLKASFSNYGLQQELMAPGIAIYSTYYNNSYTYMNGTSMAAPYVAGMFALLKEAYPDKSNFELRELMRNYTLDLGTPGFDTIYGYGMIQSFISEITPSPVQKETVTTIIIRKNDIKAGGRVGVTVKVEDETGIIVPGATVCISIMDPNGNLVYTQTSTTNSKGVATIVYATNKTSVKGEYKLKAETSYGDYKSSMAETSFRVY